MPQTETHTGGEYPKTDRINVRKNSNGNYKTLDGCYSGNSLYAATIPANTKVVSEEYAKVVTGDLSKLDSPSNHISTIIIDQSYTVDPLHVLVTGDIAVEKDENGDVIYEDGVPVTKSPDANVISWIREHTDLLCRRYNYDLGVMRIKPATDKDVNTENICMRLPKFWWKSTMIDDDHCKVDFCHEEKYVDDSWHCWEGNTLIDVKKITHFADKGPNNDLAATIYQQWMININNPSRPNNANVSGTSFVVSSTGTDDAPPVINIKQTEFKQAARNTCPNLSLVTYESHQIIALLFYAFYGGVDAQKICGKSNSNSSSFLQLIDNINAITKDTRVSDNKLNTVFWYLIDWWGNCNEFVDNLVILSNHGTAKNSYYSDYIYAEVGVLDYEGKIKRVIKVPNYDEGTTKMILGENFDLLPRVDGVRPAELDGGEGDANLLAWADGAVAGGEPGSVALRGGNGSNANGGVAYLYVGFGADDFDRYFGSRLQYTGPMVEVDSFE